MYVHIQTLMFFMDCVNATKAPSKYTIWIRKERTGDSGRKGDRDGEGAVERVFRPSLVYTNSMTNQYELLLLI